MVLPETWGAALFLLFFAILCLVLWPNLFKMAGNKWRFELFSMDFAVGALLLAILAAYTLGTRGSELDFSDSMLVAGRRAEAMAVGAGVVFALGNMLFLATIALIGLSNAALLTFSVFGCGFAILRIVGGHYQASGAALVALAIAGLFAFGAARAAHPQKGTQKVMPFSSKGGITGLLAGLAFAAVWPLMGLAQTDELGIGAYGGTLMAGIGIVVATFLLNFFFMSISLEGGQIGYLNYLTGGIKSHALGAISGAVCMAGILALYTAKTGVKEVTGFYAWGVTFLAALLMAITGVLLWQKLQLPAGARNAKWASAALFVVGTGVLLVSLR